jgi:hypothetical protein
MNATHLRREQNSPSLNDHSRYRPCHAERVGRASEAARAGSSASHACYRTASGQPSREGSAATPRPCPRRRTTQGTCGAPAVTPSSGKRGKARFTHCLGAAQVKHDTVYPYTSEVQSHRP